MRAISMVLVGLAFALGCGPGALARLDAGTRDGGITGRLGVDAGTADADAPPNPPDPSCDHNGCLRMASKVGDFSRAFLLPYLDAEVHIDNGYSVWTVAYVSDGATSLATVTLPFNIAVPVNGWSIVANDHGTTGVNDVCALSGTVGGAGLAGLFGARGMIGVATDFPGLGTPGVHPYLVSKVEARATLDALRATRQLARWQKIPLSGRYAVVGLSQGGHAVLATAAAHASYAPELQIRAFAATAPASVWEEQWRAGVALDGAHLVFHALLVYAWAAHYGWTGPSLWSDGLASHIDEMMASDCVVALPSAPTTLLDDLGVQAAAIFSAPFLAAYASGDWGAFSAFHTWFTLNRIKPYAQTAPLRIYQGDADVIVPEADTHAMVIALRLGGVDVDYQVVPGGGHTTVAFGFVASAELRTEESIAWLRKMLGAP